MEANNESSTSNKEVIGIQIFESILKKKFK
jgi:hypothetical protein